MTGTKLGVTFDDSTCEYSKVLRNNIRTTLVTTSYREDIWMLSAVLRLLLRPNTMRTEARPIP